MVIVPPFDAPWSTPTYTIWIAVLADPQGATFGANKFVGPAGLIAARRPFGFRDGWGLNG